MIDESSIIGGVYLISENGIISVYVVDLCVHKSDQYLNAYIAYRKAIADVYRQHRRAEMEL